MTARLTDLAVTRLAPSVTRREIPDGGCPGLFLQVQPSGSKGWAVRCRIAGKPVKLTIGKYPALDLRTAREKARETLALVDRGVDPRQQREADRQENAARQANTLRATAERFRDLHMKTARPATWRDSWSGLDRYVLATLGHRPIDEIRRRDLVAVLDELRERPGAHHHVVNAIGSLFRWCLDREIVESNPAARLPRPKLGVRRRLLSDAEIPIVWRAADADGYPYGRFVQLLLLTACRRGEIANLQWGEIDLPAKVITLAPERTKTGRVHVVPLSQMASGIIEGLPRFAGPHVFSTTAGRRPISGFSKLHVKFEKTLARQCKEEGVEPIEFDLHDARRTVRTGMSALRVPPHVAEAVLGHVVTGVQKHYDLWAYLDEKREALDAWAGHVERRLLCPSENVIDIRAGRTPAA